MLPEWPEPGPYTCATCVVFMRRWLEHRERTGAFADPLAPAHLDFHRGGPCTNPLDPGPCGCPWRPAVRVY